MPSTGPSGHSEPKRKPKINDLLKKAPGLGSAGSRSPVGFQSRQLSVSCGEEQLALRNAERGPRGGRAGPAAGGGAAGRAAGRDGAARAAGRGGAARAVRARRARGALASL